MHISYSEVMYDNNELILYDTIFYIYIDKYTKSQMYIIVMREKRGSNVCVGCGGRWCVVCGVWCVVCDYHTMHHRYANITCQPYKVAYRTRRLYATPMASR